MRLIGIVRNLGSIDVCGSHIRPPATLRPEQGQSFAMQAEVDQSEADAQPVMVFVASPISDLVETEDVLQYSEGMFYFGPEARLGRVLTSGWCGKGRTSFGWVDSHNVSPDLSRSLRSLMASRSNTHNAQPLRKAFASPPVSGLTAGR